MAVDDAFTTDENTVLNGASSVFAANPTTADSDPESQSFTVTGVTGGAAPVVGSPFALTSGALLTINVDGTFTYDPNGQFENLAVNESTTDSFTYTITDSQGGTDTATATITINGVNDPVTANDDAITTSKNQTLNFDVRIDEVSGGIATVADTDPDTNDMLSVTKINSGTITTSVILASGATVTLESDGTLTYDPTNASQFFGLLPGFSDTDTFTYSINDSNGGTDTATVTVTVTGSNELLMVVGDGLPDLVRDGLTPEPAIDLDAFFSDADPGDMIDYAVTINVDLLDGSSVDALPANFWVDSVSISGNELLISYSAYASNQVRLPLEITVTASSDDGLSPDVESTFTLTPDPQQTLEVRLQARSAAASGRDFTYFRAEDLANPGTGFFQLVNGLQDLDYQIDLTEYSNIDFDHSDGATTDDDLRSIRIIDTADSNQTLFTIFDFGLAADSPAIDGDILSGTSTNGELLTRARLSISFTMVIWLSGLILTGVVDSVYSPAKTYLFHLKLMKSVIFLLSRRNSLWERAMWLKSG